MLPVTKINVLLDSILLFNRELSVFENNPARTTRNHFQRIVIAGFDTVSQFDLATPIARRNTLPMDINTGRPRIRRG